MSETERRSQPSLEHRILVATALGGVAALAWVALAAGAGHTAHDDVLGSTHPPHPAAIAALLGGWLLMVAAMMLPPEIASLRSGTTVCRRWWAEVAVTAATTSTVWSSFGVLALATDAVIHLVADSRPPVAALVTPAVLVGAGAYQLSAVRRHLLAKAQRPGSTRWRRALHGLGICCGLMLVAFALGVGDLPVMALLTVAMTVERVTIPQLERLTGPLVGWALIGTGALAAFRWSG